MRTKFKLATVCVTAGFSLGLITGCNDPHPETSLALISAFGSSCASAGQWTQQALTHNQAMVSVLQSIQTNDPCKAFSNILTQMGSASTQIQSLISTPAYGAYRAAEENVQELTIALSAAPEGSALQTALSQELVTAQVNLITQRSGYVAGNQVSNRDQFANATLQYSNYMQSILQNSAGIQQCLQQSPEVAVEMASNLLALGGSFVSPAYGAAGAVIGQLINLAVEYARNKATNDGLWALYQAQVPTALGCGLEAMTELYCDANDSFDLIQLQASSYSASGAPIEPIWASLDLEERRMPVLDQWLTSIRNGTLPTDPQDAQKQNAAWAQLQSLDTYSRNVVGELAHDISLYDGAVGNSSAQANILVTTIVNVASALTSGSSPDPFSVLNATQDEFACWLAVGYSPLPWTTICPADNPLAGISGAQYVSTLLIPAKNVNIHNLLAHFNSIYAVVQQQISLEFAQTVTQDPTPILAAALESTPNNVSPLHVLEMVLNFLKSDLKNDDGTNRQKPPLLADTIAMVQKGLDVINDTTIASPKEKISRIFNAFQLENGIQYFDNRLGNFVQWDLQDRLRKGEFPKNVADILKIAGGDIRTRLIESGVTNLDSVAADLNNSRTITTNNIDAFRNFFEPTFAKSVQLLSDRAKQGGEASTGPNRPFGQTLGHLCTLLLTTGQTWPESVSWDICSQATLSSIYPDKVGSHDISLSQLKDQLAGQSDQKRYCAYHRFLRAGRLAEIMGNGPDGVYRINGFINGIEDRMNQAWQLLNQMI